jgi:DNA-binding beta-propeller fold protein YncE
MKTGLVWATLIVGCNAGTTQVRPTPTAETPRSPVKLASRAVPLPGATGPVSLDYLAIDRAAGRLWVPAGDTGSVDVLDTASGALSRVEGFKVVEREMKGRTRKLGPSSATVGDGVVYVGNRATSEVCAIDAKSLKLGSCFALTSAPDGLQYVAATHELWATTPHEHSLTILDAALKPSAKITVEGDPEGYAVDEGRGVFYTNLEDGDRTLVIDVRKKQVVATWKPGCGEAGPRGIAIDPKRGLVFVACTDHVVVLDAAHDGAILAKADTGAGVDNIDYVESRQELFVAAGKAAQLTIFQVGEKGALQAIATGPTAQGARSVVADAAGRAYVIDPTGGRILVLERAAGQ